MKQVLYFVPAIFGLVFYSLLAVFSGFGAIHAAVWICIAMLFVSAVLLTNRNGLAAFLAFWLVSY